MKVLICLSVFLASSYAGLVAYPYVPIVRAPIVHGGIPYSALGGPVLAPYKPIYGGLYDYRFGLSPAVYPLGVFPASPTIIHLTPVPAANDKKKPKKTDKNGNGKTETTTMAPKNGAEDIEDAEARDGDSSEIESV